MGRARKPIRVRWLAHAAVALHLCLSICASLQAGQGQAADSTPTAPRANLPPSGAAKTLADLAAPTTSADAPVLAIDLPTALRLVNASNPTIALARERVREAYARQQQADVLWLPNLDAGPTYLRHDGLIQNTHGDVFPVSKSSFFMGGGAVMSWQTADALFEPLIARRLTQAQAAAARAVTDNVELDVALTYLDLLRVYGALAINADILARATELQRMAAVADKNQLSKSTAEITRARVEINLRRQERIDLEGEAAVVSARLAQLLLLQPTVDLQPADPAVLPITLIDASVELDTLVATGLLNRPELAESRALVAAALARWRQARVTPLVPRLEVSYLAGEFGGGTHDEIDHWGGRGDGAAQAIWELHNLGAGDLARARANRSQYNQANLHVQEVQAQVAAEVTAAAKLVRHRERTLASAQEALRQAEETWRRLYLVAVKQLDPRERNLLSTLEPIIAIRDLVQARAQYLTQVIEYNKAQFRLYVALGQPPAEALPQAVSVPVSVPVAPATYQPSTAPQPPPGKPQK